jgi:hypothetical protein
MAVVAICAVLLAGCGGAGTNKSPKVATLNDGSTPTASGSASPSSSGSADPAAELAKFAACMRKNGINMADPEVGVDGGIQMKAGVGDGPANDSNGSGGNLTKADPNHPANDPNMAKMQKAEKACAAFAPKGGGAQLDPQKLAELQDAALKYAQCMRAEGIDMPDPDVSGGGMKITLNDGGDRAKVDAAEKKCHKFLAVIEGPGGAKPATAKK